MVMLASAGKSAQAPSCGAMRYGQIIRSVLREKTTSYWRASRYKGYGPLLDESGADHDFKLGSTGEVWLTGKYLRLWGASGQYASTPDANVLDISGDFDFRVKVAPDTWTPASTASLVSKYGSAGQRSYSFQITPAGALSMTLSFDGTAISSYVSTANLSALALGATRWVRVIRTGATVKFYTSTDYDSNALTGTWTQLGADVAAVATAIFNSTSILEFGSIVTGTTSLLSARLYQAQIFSDVTQTTKVFDANFSTQPWGTQHFVESSANAAVVSLKPGVAVVANGALYVSGVNTDYAAVPSDATLQVTGDIDIRAKIALNSYTPAIINTILAKHGVAGLRSYYFSVSTSGAIQLALSFDGTADTVYNSTVVLTTVVNAGADIWIRALRTGSTIRFYTSPDNVTWTQLGADVAGVATAINANTNMVQLSASAGAAGGTNSPATGKVYAAQVYASANGTSKVLDIDFSLVSSGTDYFTALTGQTVRVYGSAGADTNDPLFLRSVGALTSVYTPGSAANYCSIPDEAGFAPNTIFEVVAKVALADWTPTASQVIASQYTAAANRSWTFKVTSTGALLFQVSADGTASGNTTSSVVPVLDGMYAWVRARYTIATGAVLFDYSFDTTNDPTVVTWSALTGGVTGLAAMFNSTGAIEIGTEAAGVTQPLVGNFRRVKILNNGVASLDIDFTLNANYNAAQSSLTAVTGQTVTLNRSATGRKLSVIEANKFLLGVDDYLETPDHADFNFAHTDSFTALVSTRNYGVVSTVVVAKRLNGTAATPGWHVQFTGGVTPSFKISDGTELTDNGPGVTVGTGGINITAAVRDTSIAKLEAFVGGVTNGNTSDTSAGSLTTTSALRIGSYATTGSVFEGEFYGAAMARQVITAADQLLAGAELLA